MSANTDPRPAKGAWFCDGKGSAVWMYWETATLGTGCVATTANGDPNACRVHYTTPEAKMDAGGTETIDNAAAGTPSYSCDVCRSWSAKPLMDAGRQYGAACQRCHNEWMHGGSCDTWPQFVERKRKPVEPCPEKPHAHANGLWHDDNGKCWICEGSSVAGGTARACVDCGYAFHRERTSEDWPTYSYRVRHQNHRFVEGCACKSCESRSEEQAKGIIEAHRKPEKPPAVKITITPRPEDFVPFLKDEAALRENEAKARLVSAIRKRLAQLREWPVTKCCKQVAYLAAFTVHADGRVDYSLDCPDCEYGEVLGSTQVDPRFARPFKDGTMIEVKP